MEDSIDTEGVVEEEAPEIENTISEDLVSEKILANSEEDDIVKSKVSEPPQGRKNPPKRRRDRIPNIRTFAKVTVFGYRVNHSTYRYSVTPPFHTKVLWKKEMTGGEAYRFLVGVKNKNRLGKLESKSLPEE